MDNIEQGTDEWRNLRLGKFTGSRFADVLAKSKRDGKPLKARDDLIWTIVTERIQGYQEQGLNSYSMQFGTDAEPFAREAYELKTGEFVEEIAFIKHPVFDYVGVSPDGLIGTEGGIEIKCPKSPQIHLQRFIDGVPAEYMPQIQGCMWVTNSEWWDFVSYDPNTLEKFKMLIIRVYRDDKFIENLENEVKEAELEALELIKTLMLKA